MYIAHNSKQSIQIPSVSSFDEYHRLCSKHMVRHTQRPNRIFNQHILQTHSMKTSCVIISTNPKKDRLDFPPISDCSFFLTRPKILYDCVLVGRCSAWHHSDCNVAATPGKHWAHVPKQHLCSKNRQLVTGVSFLKIVWTGASQGLICFYNFTYSHTDTEVAVQTGVTRGVMVSMSAFLSCHQC